MTAERYTPENSTHVEEGRRRARAQGSSQACNARSLPGAGCECNQTLLFPLTFTAPDFPLQDWHTAEMNEHQAFCQQIVHSSSRKTVEVMHAHGRRVCQFLFVVQPVPAGMLLLPCILSFWDLDSQLTCLYKQDTSPPRIPFLDEPQRFPFIRHMVCIWGYLEGIAVCGNGRQACDSWALSLKGTGMRWLHVCSRILLLSTFRGLALALPIASL